MEDKVQFKVYTFWKEKDKPEVRRFGVNNRSATNFQYLNAKLQDVFRDLKTKNYSIAWKDEEGDEVVLASDDELMTAVQLSGDNVKLFVYCKGDKEEEYYDYYVERW